MGTGKTSVGRRLSKRLHMEFYDADFEIERITGVDLMTLYWKYGKIRFHSEENLALCRLLKKEHSVIAMGGMLRYSEERVKKMRSSGVIICLKADPKVISQRVNQKRNRPLLRQKCVVETIQALYEKQLCWESMADLVVDTTKMNFEEIVAAICQRWEYEYYGIL